MKKSQLVLRETVNALMEARQWTSNKQLVKASDGRLSNGTLGRLRQPGGENVKLDVVDELAALFGVSAHELLDPQTAEAVATPGLVASVARLASALAVEMSTHEREDIAYLLGAMAKRGGGTEQQRAQLVTLLLTVEHRVEIPAQPPTLLELAHALSEQKAEHGSHVTDSGDEFTGEKEWKDRFKPIGGAGALKGSGSTTSMNKSKPTPAKRSSRK